MIEAAGSPFPQHKLFLLGGTSSWDVMHAFNRTQGGLFLFGPDEKEHFCGLEALTLTGLDIHFQVVHG